MSLCPHKLFLGKSRTCYNEKRQLWIKESEDATISIQDKSNQRKSETIRVHKNLLYELFVLGELMDRSQYGYHLREILSALLGPFRQISWGVLYPLIGQLEQEGFITLANEVSSLQDGTNSKQRKLYAITVAGKRRFYELMLIRSDYSTESRELFIIKLNNFDALSLDQQRAVLVEYRHYLQVEGAHLESARQQVLAEKSLQDQQHVHIFRLLEFRWSSIQSEMQWLEQQMKHLPKSLSENPFESASD